MRKVVSVFVFVLVGVFCFGQNLPPDSTRWVESYDFIQGGSSSHTYFLTLGDTIIQGKTLRKIYLTDKCQSGGNHEWWYEDLYLDDTSYYGAIGQHSSQVLYAHAEDSTLHVMADFSWDSSDIYIDSFPEIGGYQGVAYHPLEFVSNTGTVGARIIRYYNSFWSGMIEWREDSWRASGLFNLSISENAQYSCTEHVNVLGGKCSLPCQPLSDLVVYPNPTSDFVNVFSDYPIDSYAVYSLDGRLLFHQEEESYQFEIDLLNYPRGVYIVKFDTTNDYPLYPRNEMRVVKF